MLTNQEKVEDLKLQINDLFSELQDVITTIIIKTVQQKEFHHEYLKELVKGNLPEELKEGLNNG